MENELETVTITESEALPIALMLAKVFKETETGELLAYVAMKLLCEQIEKELDIRSCVARGEKEEKEVEN